MNDSAQKFSGDEEGEDQGLMQPDGPGASAISLNPTSDNSGLDQSSMANPSQADEIANFMAEEPNPNTEMSGDLIAPVEGSSINLAAEADDLLTLATDNTETKPAEDSSNRISLSGDGV